MIPSFPGKVGGLSYGKNGSPRAKDPGSLITGSGKNVGNPRYLGYLRQGTDRTGGYQPWNLLSALR